jgi:hypothetical protein
MCKICTEPPEKLDNLTYLNCSNCPLVTTIPALANLTELNCYNCPLLTTIPALANLAGLDCSNCPLLATIPALANLIRLYCANCPLLTAIPALANLTELNCADCPWLIQNAHVYPAHQPSVARIQNWFRRGRKQTFKRYIRTRAFNEWFWAGDQAGGRVHARHMEWSLRRTR